MIPIDAVVRVEKNSNYTTMSNYHLRDMRLSLRTVGLLSKILSLPPNWNFTILGLAAICRDGSTSIRSALRELETTGYLQRRQTRDSHGKLSAMEYVFYEEPQPVSPHAGNPHTDKPIADEPQMDAPRAGVPQQLSTEVLSTEKLNTYLPSTIESNLSKSKTSADAMAMDMNIYREIIRDNIDYQILCKDHPIETGSIDELVEIMVEAVCSTQPYIRIARQELPQSVVKSRFLKLNSEHILYVLDCLHKNTTQVRNIRQYLMTALYQAPTTIDNYYTALVNHDLSAETL